MSDQKSYGSPVCECRICGIQKPSAYETAICAECRESESQHEDAMREMFEPDCENPYDPVTGWKD